jgi:hypothetical protein
MDMTSEWITDRLPTKADANGDGEVQVPRSARWQHHTLIVPGQPWWTPWAAERATAGPTAKPVIDFNINSYVYVRLTPVGRNVLRSQGIDLPAELPGGWSKWQMFYLMNVFGPHLWNGCDVPFETNIKIGFSCPEPQGLAAELCILYERWWQNKGSGISPLVGEDQESHVRRVACLAWVDGANARSGYGSRNAAEQ